MERRHECPTDTQHVVNLSAYAWALDQIGEGRERRILDAACGFGFGSDRVAEGRATVVGVDVAIAVVADAAARYRRPNLNFAAMDCAELGFPDACFDAVLSFETIEHISDDRRYVEEISRVLRPDGWLVLSTPRAPSPDTVPKNPYHVREYTWEQLLRLLDPYYNTIERYGRRLGPRLARLEQELNRIRNVAPAKVRQVVPRRIRHLLGSLVSKSLGGAGLEEVGVEDIEYVGGLEETATLLAVCRRR
jgi:SAM-dependent methyltransferase